MKKAKASPSPHAPQSRQRREHEIGLCGSLWTAGAAYKIRFKEGKKDRKKMKKSLGVLMPEACFMVEAFFKDHTRTQIRDEEARR